MIPPWTSNNNLVPGVWYNRKVQRDHLQVIGANTNPLVLQADDGTFTQVADTIDAIKLPATAALIQQQSLGTTSGNESNTGFYFAGAFSAVGLVGLITVGSIVYRRRRQSQTPQESAFRSSGNWQSRGDESLTISPEVFISAGNPKFAPTAAEQEQQDENMAESKV